jgi:tetratricopeptide (TPR) repeat protein
VASSPQQKTPLPEIKTPRDQGKNKPPDATESRPLAQEGVRSPEAGRKAEKEAPATLPDDNSLIAKITPRTPPQRAASLRLTDEGRRLIEGADYRKALLRLERSISIDASNPYSYYYLGQVHYRMGRYQESLNFLDVAESSFSAQPFWLAETLALKGENFRALGSLERAGSNYSEALRFNPANRVATEGLKRLHGEGRPAQR